MNREAASLPSFRYPNSLFSSNVKRSSDGRGNNLLIRDDPCCSVKIRPTPPKPAVALASKPINLLRLINHIPFAKKSAARNARAQTVRVGFAGEAVGKVPLPSKTKLRNR